MNGRGATTFVVAATAMAAATAACGSSQPAASGSSWSGYAAVDPTHVPQSSGGGSTTKAGAPVSSSAHGAGSASTPVPGSVAAGQPDPTSTPLQYVPGTTPAPASATLSAGCVSPRGAQTLHIRSTAGLSVSFDTQYSDSNEGRMYGGEGTGVIGPDGTFQSTWTEAANAPLGQAVVYVAVAGGQMTAFRQATFNVASRC